MKLSTSHDLVVNNQDIIHTTSGLVLQYKSAYTPATNIVVFTTVIPIVADMCYLIPVNAMMKIPRCNLTNHILNSISRGQKSSLDNTSRKLYRKKRFLSDIISIGIGTAALSLSTANTIQMMNLKRKMTEVSESITELQKNHRSQRAQILQLAEGQLKLAAELNNTQYALNRTMYLVNEHTDTLRAHDEAIRTLGNFSVFLNNKLNAFMHSVEGHFLHNSIEKILNDKVNLDFIHHDDTDKVIEVVMQAVNITLREDNNNPISLIEVITRLIVQQSIHFVPTPWVKATSNGVSIGNLVITSFFAASNYNYNEDPFQVYQAITVPFNYQNKRVRLAQMPAFIAIRAGSRQFIRWTATEAGHCNFNLMTSCRFTPAIRKDLEDTCLYQILSDSSLTECRVEPHNESIFLERIGQYWIISSNSTIKCHYARIPDSDRPTITDNHEITLAPVALITAKESSLLICDKFSLPGLVIQSTPQLVLYQNATVIPVQENLLDLSSILHNSTKWEKLVYIPSQIEAIINFIRNTTASPEILFLGQPKTHFTLSFIIVLIGILLVLVIFQICYFYCKHKKRAKRVAIDLPP